MERIWFVKDIPLLERLAIGEVRPLEYRSRARSFPRGSPIALPNDPCVFLVTEGRARVQVAYEGDQSPITVTLEPGDIFGIVPGCAELLHGDSLESLKDLTLVAIPNDLFHRLMERHAEYFLAVTKRIGWNSRRIISWVNNLMYRTTNQRIARLFLSLVNTSSLRPAHEVTLPVPLTVRDMTRLTASADSVVHYVIGELTSDDLIRTRGNTIDLLDPRRLAHMHLKGPVPAPYFRLRKRVLR